MPVDVPRVYIDANVLLAYIGNEVDRADVVEALLDEARRGQVEVITSVLSVAEVAYGAIERDHGLTPAGEAQIDTLWEPGSPITLVDVSETTARRARTLIRAARSAGVSTPRSIDAMHLASALVHDAAEILTYEAQKRSTWQRLTGLPVREPTVTQPQLGLDMPPA